ncbi:MAG: NUDIX domain-containing protein [bacterium]|nr:NUDIX domain-containing protein [bacterium]
MTEPQWLKWAKELQAIAQTGNHFAQNDFDVERFTRVGEIAAEMLARQSNASREEILSWNLNEQGYATPKVDVRGAAFRDGKILMVRERLDNDRWTLPGGWADVNETPREAVEREVFEESGFQVKAVKLAMALDRVKQGHLPHYPHHVYKLFFLCDITGGEARVNMEASEVAFFALEDIGDLSASRVNMRQIELLFAHRRNLALPTEFD